MKILINLIGGQPVPNYLAAKVIRPDKILNVCSKASESIMKRINITIQVETIEPSLLVDAFNFDENYNLISNYLRNSDDEIIINITGGTKIMSIAAFEAAKQFNLKSVYVDSENHFLYSLIKGIVEKSKLEEKILIDDYFKLHGVSNSYENRIDYSEDEIHQLKEFDKYILDNPGFVSPVLELTDKILQYKRRNKKKWLKENIEIQKSQNRFEWKNGKGSIKYSIKGLQFVMHFENEKLLEYHNGKWFEKVVYGKLVESGNYDEVIMNYEIFNAEGDKINELDIVAIKNEKLDIFECKSGGLFQEDLNKLKAIKDTLGKYSNLNLITYYRINENTENERIVKQKLKDYNIKNYVYFRSNLNFGDDKSNTNL